MYNILILKAIYSYKEYLFAQLKKKKKLVA